MEELFEGRELLSPSCESSLDDEGSSTSGGVVRQVPHGPGGCPVEA